MRGPVPPTSTNAPTKHSKTNRSPAPPRWAANQAATSPPTHCSPSSKRCDYADQLANQNLCEQQQPHPSSPTRQDHALGIKGVRRRFALTGDIRPVLGPRPLEFGTGLQPPNRACSLTTHDAGVEVCLRTSVKTESLLSVLLSAVAVGQSSARQPHGVVGLKSPVATGVARPLRRSPG
jgi:hypothetical protein